MLEVKPTGQHGSVTTGSDRNGLELEKFVVIISTKKTGLCSRHKGTTLCLKKKHPRRF